MKVWHLSFRLFPKCVAALFRFVPNDAARAGGDRRCRG